MIFKILDIKLSAGGQVECGGGRARNAHSTPASSPPPTLPKHNSVKHSPSKAISRALSFEVLKKDRLSLNRLETGTSSSVLVDQKNSAQAEEYVNFKLDQYRLSLAWMLSGIQRSVQLAIGMQINKQHHGKK